MYARSTTADAIVHNKSVDVTVIMSPIWDAGWPWPAPAYICESLRRKGYSVQFLDLNISLYRTCKCLGLSHLWDDDSYYSAWGRGNLNFLAKMVDLEQIQGQVIAFSTTILSLGFSVSLARLVRQRYPRRKIIFGGHAVFLPRESATVPTELADAICKGDGEYAIVEAMESGLERLEKIPGLYLPSPSGWQLTSERPLISDLDSVFFPTFAEISLEKYANPFLPIMGSRGCIGRCIFCGDRYRLPGFRSRSAKNQVDELEYLSANFKVEHFPFHDPLMNGDIGILVDRSREILRRGLDIRYGGNLMTRSDMPEELFPLMRQSGMTVALIGVESGSARTLRFMRKRHNPEMAAQFLKNLHNAGIRVELNFIVGFPTETEEDFQETLRWIRHNRNNIDAVVSAGSFCLIPSDILDRREKFDIVVTNMENAIHDWYVRGGENTLDIRRRRLKEFNAFCIDQGLMNEYVRSDEFMFKTAGVPTAKDFYKAFVETGPVPGQPGLVRAERQLEQMKKTVHDQSLAVRALNSLRERGVSATLKRARAWYDIHRGR